MKKIRIIGAFIAICAMPTCAMAGERALPVTDGIVLQSETGVQTSADLETYSIGNRNYVQLRVLGAVLDFNVNWNGLTKEITITEGAEAKGQGETKKDAKEQEAMKVVQTVVVDGEKQSLTGYIVQGYTYFSVRDIAAVLDYTCTWDEAERKVVLEKGHGAKASLQVPENMTQLVNMALETNSKGQVIAENNVIYLTKSQDYAQISAYLQEQIDPKFDLEQYHVEEVTGIKALEGSAPLGQGDFVIPRNLLRFRYEVHGVVSNFGYDVLVLEGFAKIVSPVGIWNEKLDVTKVAPFPYTEEALEAMVRKEMEDPTRNIAVNDIKIHKYFDMETLKIVAEVEVNRTMGDIHMRGDTLYYSGGSARGT